MQPTPLDPIFVVNLLPNHVSEQEKMQGVHLLFDGKTTKGWRGAYRKDFPKHGWVVKDGELRGELLAGVESSDAGDIVTLKKYRNFELVFDWKIGQGGNSGVKYFIDIRSASLMLKSMHCNLGIDGDTGSS